ncbi:ribulose-5-phosphate 4-epimerase/fuculose-1-phosphate aldolase [Paraburkholderia sp. GAS42]
MSATDEIHSGSTESGSDHGNQRERTLRVELAGTYRVFAMLGWTELIYNHITVRLPGPDTHFLINPFGLHYSEVTASNLVRIDLDGRVVGESKYCVNPAGFVVHAAIHRTVPHAHCVMHTHTTAGLAVACSQVGLDNASFYSAQLRGRRRVSRFRRHHRASRRRAAPRRESG